MIMLRDNQLIDKADLDYGNLVGWLVRQRTSNEEYLLFKKIRQTYTQTNTGSNTTSLSIKK